jgi:hypothetical protein
MQVWRGSCVLADYIETHAHELQQTVVVELGCGVGAAGLVAARHASRVFLTDAGCDILQNCDENRRANGLALVATVRRLDWMDPPEWLFEGGADGCAAAPFGWSADDVHAAGQAQILLAADVVYDNTLTEAFMRIATALLRFCQARRRPEAAPPRLLLALERRPCFTLADRDVRCPAYDFWRAQFEAEGEGGEGAEAGPSRRRRGALLGRRVDIGAVPQAVEQYERTPLLELWELRLAALVPP